MKTNSGLIGHWKLTEDCDDHSGMGHHGHSHGTVPAGPEGAAFDGQASWIEVENSPSLCLGTGNFSIATWVHTERNLTDVPGDILSRYDHSRRNGFNFGIHTLAGVTSAQSNSRNVYFGIDAGHIDQVWADCGRPGNAVWPCALAVHKGSLYAGTFEMGAKEKGHVYRYDGTDSWTDCGSPDSCNSVTALAVCDGSLYAGVSHYRSIGSSLSESPNQYPGGRIYRYEGDRQWVGCGRPTGPSVGGVVNPDYMKRFVGWSADAVDSIHGMAVFDGSLYAIPMYHQGLFRYDGGTQWTDCGSPGVRLMALTVFNGHLYAAGNEGQGRGGVFRYEGGSSWTRTGDQPGVDQVYAFAIHEGKLYAGTWPEACVFRYDGGETWTPCGRLGGELEVMAMAVYNGKLYAGTLPSAEVYRYDGGERWTCTGSLDATPDVRYRRAWSMAIHKGRLYAGTLPSGRVHALEAGRSLTCDRELEPGWRHIAAVRDDSCLNLYIDGKPVAASSSFNPADYDLSNDQPLKIGFGAHDCFNGRLRDLRLYDLALTHEEIVALSAVPEVHAIHTAGT